MMRGYGGPVSNIILHENARVFEYGNNNITEYCDTENRATPHQHHRYTHINILSCLDYWQSLSL